nr:MAG TPA: protein of unknown function (DUF4406) [Caudoviricetes sp.]
MKKVFVSQPMKGKTDEEILNERNEAVAAAKKKLRDEVELIDSFFCGAPADAKPAWYLGEAIKMLSTADIAFFAKGWEDARGCKIEHRVALEYGIPVIEG